MEIEIIVFKNSGKYYTSDTVECENDIYLFKEEFEQFIRDNNPAKMSDSFIVVKDTDKYPDQSFHYALYRYEDLYKGG